jgi:hypothetical protein
MQKGRAADVSSVFFFFFFEYVLLRILYLYLYHMSPTPGSKPTCGPFVSSLLLLSYFLLNLL